MNVTIFVKRYKYHWCFELPHLCYGSCNRMFENMAFELNTFFRHLGNMQLRSWSLRSQSTLKSTLLSMSLIYLTISSCSPTIFSKFIYKNNHFSIITIYSFRLMNWTVCHFSNQSLMDPWKSSLKPRAAVLASLPSSNIFTDGNILEI